jgi:hypothetical protein
MVAQNKAAQIRYNIGDEVSFARGSGMAYGEISRLLEGGAAVEILFEDGHREIKRSNDRGVRLLRRASGASEMDERHSNRHLSRDREIDEVRRSDVRKR